MKEFALFNSCVLQVSGTPVVESEDKLLGGDFTHPLSTLPTSFYHQGRLKEKKDSSAKPTAC